MKREEILDALASGEIDFELTAAQRGHVDGASTSSGEPLDSRSLAAQAGK